MMSFLIYFAVLLFTAASALFGLDLMTSPLPAAHHHHPRPQVADNATPAKADTATARKQADKTANARSTNAKSTNAKSTNAMASRDDDKTNSDRALSPVYPTTPGTPKSEVRTVYPPSNPALGAVVSQQNEALAKQSAPQPSTAETASNATQPQTTGSAPVKEASAPEANQPVPQPVAQQAPASCNVQACAGAYQSFRASDCTYQPFSGERRVCTKQMGSAQHLALQPRQLQARRNNDSDTGLRDTVRRVRAMPPRQDDAYDDDEYDDAPVMAGRGRRLFVVPDDGGDDYYR